MSSHESGSPFPDQAMKLGSPSSGTYGSTNNDLEAGTGDDNDRQRLSYAGMGIPSLSQPATYIDGKIRTYKDIKKKEWVFICVSGIAIVIAMGFTIYKLATVDKHHTDFVFALVCFVNECVCLYYLSHGVLRERRYEIIILVITTIIMVFYLTINYARGLKNTIKLVRLIIAWCLGALVVVMGGCLGRRYRTTGELIFKTVGASSTQQAMCNKLFLFQDLLKHDLQLGITLALFTHVNDPDVNALDWVALAVGLVISAAWFILGHVCVRRESKILTYLFTVLSPVQLCYVIYKIAMASTHLKLYPVLAPCSITTGCLAFVVRVTVIILNYLVSMNYGTGLNEKVFRERP